MRQLFSQKNKSKQDRLWLRETQDTVGSNRGQTPASRNVTDDYSFIDRSPIRSPDLLGSFATASGPSSERSSNVVDKPKTTRFYSSVQYLSPMTRSTRLKDIDEQRTFSRDSSCDKDESKSNGENSASPSHTQRTLRSRTNEDERKVPNRFPLPVEPDMGDQPVVTEPQSERMDYQKCEDEPIHTPGAVQNFGALLGLKYNEHGDLEVRIASENARKILGYGPEQLFELGSFLDILNPDFQEEMAAHVNYCLLDIHALKEETRLDVFRRSLTFPYEPEIHLWCAVHLAPAPENMVICEFEEFSYLSHMVDPDPARKAPLTPFQLMKTGASAEDLAKSTTSASLPLPILQIAHQRDKKELTSLDIVNAMSQCEKQISRCKSLEHLYEVTVGLIAELTGYHRVMFYRFDDDKNGCVEAELLDPRGSTEIYRGLHFPASDIPLQAQKLYVLNRIRLLHDRDARVARLVCRSEADSAILLDLSHAYLRAISPFHLTYLRNIGVRSTMSISIIIDSDLWGMIVCQGYGNFGVRIPLPLRELCRNIGECAAIHIQRCLLQQRIEIRRALTAGLSSKAATNFTLDKTPDLLRFVDADSAWLTIGNKHRMIGNQDHHSEASAIVSYLRKANYTTICCSQHIRADLPGIVLPPGTNIVAGILFVPFNAGQGKNFLVFFRKMQSINVTWAGNPNDKHYQPDSECLNPRKSFKRWTETVGNTSRKWTGDQLDIALMLSTMYETFVDMWPDKGSEAREQLLSVRALSERLRPALEVVFNYLEMALQHDVQDETRSVLIKAGESLTSLTPVVRNLFKITEEASSDPVSSPGYMAHRGAAQAYSKPDKPVLPPRVTSKNLSPSALRKAQSSESFLTNGDRFQGIGGREEYYEDDFSL